MSARAIGGSQLEEISRYLERMSTMKTDTERQIQALRSERDDLDGKIAELRAKREATERRIRTEQERAARHDRAMQQAKATFDKLLDSTATLADFVKKEYQEAKREMSPTGEHH